MREHSKMYIFWVEFELDGLCKRPIVWNSSIKCFVSGQPFIGQNRRMTLGVWFEPDNFEHNGKKTPLVNCEFAFRKTETYDQYISTWLEWERKHIQKYFDRQSARAPAEYRLKFKVRYGRANSKECPFYVPQKVMKSHFDSTSCFRSALLKNIAIYQKIKR